jgi:hypothetical protein
MTSRKIVFALCLLLAFAAAALAQDNPAPAGVPKLVIASFTHDFGEVKAGSPLEFAFVVKNTGKADLLINSVAPG